MYRKLLLILVVFISSFFVFNNDVKALDNTYEISYVLEGRTADECEGVFDEEVIEFLQQIFNVFKYAAPLLCLALSIVDFLKAVASQDKDALTKAAKTTAKRIVYAIILFFLPNLINFLFNLLGWYGTCGIS